MVHVEDNFFGSIACFREDHFAGGQTKLRSRYRDDACHSRWPDKLAALEPLRKKTGSLTIMPNRFHQRAIVPPERKQMFHDGIELQTSRTRSACPYNPSPATPAR
jgi:hypothetical protein